MNGATCQGRAPSRGNARAGERCQHSRVHRRPPGPRRGQRGYTLTDLLVSVSIFLMVIGALLSSHLFGLRLTEFSRNSIEASDGFVRQFGSLSADLSSARGIAVGNGNRSYFAAVPAGSPLRGPALQVYPSTDTNQFVRYYWDSADRSLKRLASDGREQTLAQCLTNQEIFALEDYAGATLTQPSPHAVVAVRLQFYALSGTGVAFGPDKYYTAYQRQFRIASKTLE
jgi:hypothetical protein